MSRLKDVALAAGVTPAVVSRLLNGDSQLRVSPETRARVLRAAVDLDYSPNLAAQTLRLSRSNLIAMVVHDIFNPVYAKIEEGAQAAAANSGHFLMLGNAESLGNAEGNAADLIRGGALGGLILQGTGGNADLVLRRAVRNRLRTVLLQEGGEPDFTVVRLPDEQAGRIAAEHLLTLGHERIGCIGTRQGLRLSVDRAAGWRHALETNGIDIPESWLVWAGSDLQAGFDGMVNLLGKAPEITGVVVCNVVAAIGALSAAASFGRRVPDTLSVVAMHDTEFAKHTHPPMTVVNMALGTMGYRAVELLLADSPPTTRDVLVDQPAPALIERQSTRRL